MKKLIILSMLLLTLSLAACSTRSDKQSYIDATIEATCMLFETEDIFDPQLAEQAKEVYAKHGFKVDENTIGELTAQYQDDEDVESAILAGISECSSNYADKLKEKSDTTEPAEEEATEEATTE